MRRKINQLSKLLIGTGLLLGLGSAAQASFLTDILTSGVLNGFEDQSREAYIDTNGDGMFGTGDVYTGFLKFDNKDQPDAVDLGNNVYAIFSQEVVSIQSPTAVEFGPVQSDANLRLDNLLASFGLVAGGPQDTTAVFSSEVGFSTDLILGSPGDRTGNGTTTLADYLDLIIQEGTLDIIAGIYDTTPTTCAGGTTDCFQGTGGGLAGGDNNILLGLPATVTIGNFVGGLETSQDPPSWMLLDAVVAGAFQAPAALLTTAELAISNGAARGATGVDNAAEWVDASELTNNIQCSPDPQNPGVGALPCGLINDADFGIFPESIPEPATIALLGGGLFGLGVVRRRRRRL